MYNKLILILLLNLAACSYPALDKEIVLETAVTDVNEIEQEEGELPRYQQKFLNSVAFIADDKQVEQAKIKELFSLFTGNKVTYRDIFNELEKRHQFEESFTNEKLKPVYIKIDSLCNVRQALLSFIQTATSQQKDSIISSGANINFMNSISADIVDYYKYNTPEKLYGECVYLTSEDELYQQHDSLNKILNKELQNRFKLTTEYYSKLNHMFDVHQ